jgi:hypothetical protein
MSKLDDQISDYFAALHRDSLDRGGDDVSVPLYPVGEPLRPGGSGHRRIALIAVGVAAVIALAAFGLVRSTEDSSPYVGTPTDRPAPPPVPDGWKPVVFQTVQFAVPEDWPVVTHPSCDELAPRGVYLQSIPRQQCSETADDYFAAIAVAAGFDPDFEIAQTQMTIVADTDPPGDRATLQSLNGLRAVVRAPETVCDDCAFSYEVELLDEDVLINLSFTDPSDRLTALALIDTVGAAPGSTEPTTPVPPPTTTTVPTTDPLPAVPPSEPQPDPDQPQGSTTGGDLNAFCAAVEDYRQQQGLNDPEGYPSPAALPAIRRILDAAPTAFRPPLETMVSWLEDGAPAPRPAAVTQSALQTTQDWAGSCSGSSAK